MKRNKIFAAILFLALGVTATAQSGHDLQDDGLKGAVKRVDAVMYEARYDFNDNLERGDQMEHLITEYNAKGQRLSLIHI